MTSTYGYRTRECPSCEEETMRIEFEEHYEPPTPAYMGGGYPGCREVYAVEGVCAHCGHELAADELEAIEWD